MGENVKIRTGDYIFMKQPRQLLCATKCYVFARDAFVERNFYEKKPTSQT